MKSFIVGTLGVVLSSSAFATSPVAPEISPVLKKLGVAQVGKLGTVLKRSATFPIETFLVGIPVTFNTDPCTDYAGHREVSTRTPAPTRIVAPPTNIELVGATDPTNEVCTQIAIVRNTLITVAVTMNNESVPPHALARKLIAIDGRSLLVVVDSANEKVTIQPVRTLN